MAVTIPYRLASPRPIKRRRTATSVFSGDFDPRPPRDVLTSLLNGVGPYKLVEGDEEERRMKRRERKLREKEKKRLKKQMAQAEHRPGVARKQSASQVSVGEASRHGSFSFTIPAVNSSTSSFWRVRGPAVVPERSVSPTPPPELFSPPTPGPSDSSTISRTSSKRPHTPEDGFSLYDGVFMSPPPPAQPKVRKRRSAARKGWKGWVEGSPPPSDKLINLDSAPVMQERRTRSGKNFDAISEGQDTWINPDSALDH